VKICFARLRNTTRYRGPLSDIVDPFFEGIKSYIATHDIAPSFYRLSLDGGPAPADASAIERADVVAIVSEAEFAWQTKGRLHTLDVAKSNENLAQIAPLFKHKPLVLLTYDRGDTPKLYRERTFAGVELGSIGEVDEADGAFAPGLAGMKYWFIRERAPRPPEQRDISFCYWGASNKHRKPDGGKSGDERNATLLGIRKRLGKPPGSCFIGSFPYKDLDFAREFTGIVPWAHRAAYTLCFNWLEPEALTARYFEAIALGVVPLTWKQYGGAFVPRELRVWSLEQAIARMRRIDAAYSREFGMVERHLLARLPSLQDYHQRFAARLDEELTKVTSMSAQQVEALHKKERRPPRKAIRGGGLIPIVEEYDGIAVVRDDLFPGGTKARFIPKLFEGVEEVVYASPAQGGAQYSLAHVAHGLGKRATIFVAARREPHLRQIEAKALGAKIVLISFGMLSNVQAKAREYAEKVGARLAPFGMDTPEAIAIIAEAARGTGENPDEVWCAAGSGTLCRALKQAWPRAHHVAVAVGRNIPADKLDGAEQIRYPRPFEFAAVQPPFPSDPHYDAKAWQLATARARSGRRVLLWNVVGPAIAPR